MISEALLNNDNKKFRDYSIVLYSNNIFRYYCEISFSIINFLSEINKKIKLLMQFEVIKSIYAHSRISPMIFQRNFLFYCDY